ncbi:HAMP domain-containing sensor histidine kinase [Micromonospora sp. URMC 105]|uniref:HAMP domain-containing sensor histidine kinase n=1 Tax=Micromonospora sp. URMC 105 TaxID=3423413 RepID=UPI003F195C8A
MPLHRSLLLRLLALSALVSVCSIAATAWLAVRTTTGAIRHEQGQALADDAHIYDTLLGYGATHRDWTGVDETVRRLAQETGRRIVLTTEDRTPVADSGSGSDRPPANPSVTIDPLAVDAALAPDSATHRIDPRAVGPFLLPADERAKLRATAAEAADCIRLRLGADADIVEGPSGRPHLDAPGADPARTTGCGSVRAALEAPTETERTALAQLNALVNTCLDRRHVPTVQLDLDPAWKRWRPEPGPAPPESRQSAEQPFPYYNRSVTDCIGSSRREQLTPYVAPAALLFAAPPGVGAPAGFDLSPANTARIAWVAGLVLLVTVTVTVLAGIRLVRPLHALIAATRRMRDGNGPARVKVTGRDEIARLAAVFNEMSERRERLEELRRTMVSDVAHELRTPVSNIRGWLEAAEDGIVARDRELILSLLEEALLLQHIIDDLQDLAAADAGALTLHRQLVDVTDLVNQVANANGERAERAGVTLSTRAEAAPVLIADPVRLRQAIGNLVANALRHTPTGGAVTIRAESTGDDVLIEVTDTGTGIEAEDLPRVFDRFWRAEKSRSRQTAGSGLGLAIVRKLVEAHGGTVSAASTPGRGSTFTIRLPTGIPHGPKHPRRVTAPAVTNL